MINGGHKSRFWRYNNIKIIWLFPTKYNHLQSEKNSVQNGYKLI